MSESTDKITSVNEYNKMSKYEDLEIQIEKMWPLKTTTVSEIIGKKIGQINSFIKYLAVAD